MAQARNAENSLTKTSYSPIPLIPYYLKKKSAFTLAEVFSPSLKVHRKIAFTLAEVLITLGVIGVVAALVMPGVIRNYQRQTLRTAFMQTDALIQEALQKTVLEYGYTNFLEIKSQDIPVVDIGEFPLAYEFTDMFFKQFVDVKKDNRATHIVTSGKRAWRFFANKGQGVDYYNLFATALDKPGFYTLPNGAFMTAFKGPELTTTVDTNGMHKGPNKQGYDIFTYNFSKYRYDYPDGLCDPLVPWTLDQVLCYRYARANVSPYGKGDYWNDFLWKSKEELQKMKNGK